MAKYLKLNNGCEIPVIGLGTFSRDPGQMEQAVKDAIDAGYRHFDCAWLYRTEKEIGRAIKAKLDEGVIKREDLFITSKLWNNYHEKKLIIPKLKESLNDLGLKYLDLFLIHWPMGFKETVGLLPAGNNPNIYSDIDYLETWQGMEQCVQLGLTKSIGLSNFNSEQIDRILNNCTIKPAVNQIEVNPNLNQKKLIQFCKERDIVITGYCPLSGKTTSDRTEYPELTILDSKLAEIGRKYNKTPAQVVLNYLLSFGICVIPKSVKKSRIIENMDVFDFQLDQEDTTYLDSLNTNERICDCVGYRDHKYYSFNIEF